MLPQNGRIVIVDDRLAEAKPLMDILSKRRIPYNYYSGQNHNDFPDDINENKFRVLFLDLNIFEATRDVKGVIGVLSGILGSLVPDNPNPYLLVIWSKKKKLYADALSKHFDNELPSKKPAETIFLHKQDYFDIEPDSGEWIPQDGCLERINADLSAELNRLSLLGNLFTWENIVHKNTCDTLNEFSSFYPVDDNWDANSKAVIFNLAKSVAGDCTEALTDNEKLGMAIGNLNSFLSDKLENDIHHNRLGDVEGINDQGIAMPKPVIAKINSKLHIFPASPLGNQTEQGNIYFLDDAAHKMIERIICDKTCESAAKAVLIMESGPALIQLDITPVCDYAQDKGYVRLVSGVLLNENFHKKHCKNSNFCYRTPVFYIGEEEKFMLFDFRFIETLNKETILNRGIAPAFRLRKEICTDIQSQLSNQVNRPGINNL